MIKIFHKPIKRKTKWYLFITINVIAVIIFFGWFFTDFPIKKSGTLTVTTSNMFDYAYFKVNDKIWRGLLKRIEKLESSKIKEILLVEYIGIIPVEQSWHPLYVFKRQAILDLSDLYIQNKNWEGLEKVSIEYCSMDELEASFYFNLGLSYEMRGNNEMAKDTYYNALAIESTHKKTLVNLIGILSQEGNYYEASRLLEPYFTMNEYLPKEVCLFWGTTSFKEENKQCLHTAKYNGYYSYLFTINNSNVIRKIRLDLPFGRTVVDRVELASENNNLFDNDYSLWKKNDINKDNNIFYSTGTDPYITLNLDNEIKDKVIKINLIISESINEELFNLKKVLDEKISE